MKFFDPHAHMTSRTTDDYMAMYKAGIRAIVEPAFWLGQPRTHVGSFEDYFQMLVGWERFRASQFGIRHYCAIGLNSKEANNDEVAEQVLNLLPKYLSKESVVAIGEIGYDDMTEAEHYYFKKQLEISKEFDLPVIIHSPHRDKKNGIIESIKLVKELKLNENKIIIDHNNEETLPLVLETDCWAGHTIYPRTKMDADRMVALAHEYGSKKILVNSSCDWGVSNPLATTVVAQLMKNDGFDDNFIRTIFWDNPIEFFTQSGVLSRKELEQELPIDQEILYQGNSVLRGQKPQKKA